MNSLERPLIEKAGYANGWENVRSSTPEQMTMFSARHRPRPRSLGPASRSFSLPEDFDGVLAPKSAEGHALVEQQAAGLAAGSVLVAGLLDLMILTDGFLTHGRWHAHGGILFESTTPLDAFPEFRADVIIYESMRSPRAGNRGLTTRVHGRYRI